MTSVRVSATITIIVLYFKKKVKYIGKTIPIFLNNAQLKLYQVMHYA